MVVWTKSCPRDRCNASYLNRPTDRRRVACRDIGSRPVILALTIARRELRGGVKGLWIVLLCLALGVGVIAAVGTLRAAVGAGVAADGRALLGGDLEVDGGSQRPPDTLIDWLHARRAKTSRVVQMRSMLVAPSGE